jgi:hypothetical protein
MQKHDLGGGREEDAPLQYNHLKRICDNSVRWVVCFGMHVSTCLKSVIEV